VRWVRADGPPKSRLVSRGHGTGGVAMGENFVFLLDFTD